MTADEAAALRAQGYDFYDWAPGEVRLVTSWDQDMDAVERLAAAIARAVNAARRPARIDASIVIPFIIFTADLGIDLDRHPRPARHRPAAMVGRLSLRARGGGDGAGGASGRGSR